MTIGYLGIQILTNLNVHIGPRIINYKLIMGLKGLKHLAPLHSSLVQVAWAYKFFEFDVHPTLTLELENAPRTLKV